MATATPIFIADAPLGRLATWLRLLGFDAVYGRDLSEDVLLRRARLENRVLLTRNRRLCRRRHLPPHVFVEADDFREQLRQLFRVLALETPRLVLVRCSRCNVELERTARDQVRGQVPAYVFASQSTFSRCPECGRLYWRATHVERMREELKLVQGARRTGRDGLPPPPLRRSGP